MAASKDGSALGSIIAAIGAGLLFLLCWLIVGVPLLWSAAAGVVGYVALWMVGGALGDRIKAIGSKPLDTAFVDKDLAAKTVAQGKACAARVRELLASLEPGNPLAARFSSLAKAIDAIAADVKADPKDAPAAQAFLSYQGETVARLLRLVLDIQSRGDGASRAGTGSAREKLEKRLEGALEQLQLSFRNHLANLQEDNIAELQAELDVLEQSLGFDYELQEAMKAGKGPQGSGDSAARSGQTGTSRG
jgi:hypothetical protein